jgi:hypothetical protein
VRAVLLHKLRDDAQRVERDRGRGTEHRHGLSGHNRPKSRRCSRFELDANPVEAMPSGDATATIAIHLQFFGKTIGVAHKEQPSSR